LDSYHCIVTIYTYTIAYNHLSLSLRYDAGQRPINQLMKVEQLMICKLTSANVDQLMKVEQLMICKLVSDGLINVGLISDVLMQLSSSQ
jgi:hypothetical protein